MEDRTLEMIADAVEILVGTRPKSIFGVEMDEDYEFVILDEMQIEGEDAFIWIQAQIRHGKLPWITPGGVLSAVSSLVSDSLENESIQSAIKDDLQSQGLPYNY